MLHLFLYLFHNESSERWQTMDMMLLGDSANLAEKEYFYQFLKHQTGLVYIVD